jgi:hypothetical protein
MTNLFFLAVLELVAPRFALQYSAELISLVHYLINSAPLRQELPYQSCTLHYPILLPSAESSIPEENDVML